MTRRLSARWILLSVAVVGLATTAAAQRPAVPSSPDSRTVVHVLNRLGFGPSPGEVVRVQRLGLAGYIDQQLHPTRIPDEAMARRLSAFSTLSLSSRELADRYFAPAAAGRQQQQQRQQANLVLRELQQQKILRAIYSERQLEEVMVDFWFNHFNVFAAKGATRQYITAYERDTIRPHAFGRFRDLLGAVAESPAMLIYLDNWRSAAPPNPPVRNQPRGLNENYARELLELHTIGVEGDYTQEDVQEVARAFTGWTIDRPRRAGGFRFEPRMHDEGEKSVLGMKIPRGGGKRDGEMVLDLLARHPSTARFIATKLARRFVSDDPPQTLVGRAAARFRATDGDIREVLRTIVTSPEFFAPEAYRAKVKTPLEFVASAVRLTAVDLQNAAPSLQALRQLGMPQYMCQPPTGYADTADAWVNTGALLNRMNFALALAGSAAWSRREQASVTVDAITSAVLANDLSKETHAIVANASDTRQALALLLGSPEFQRK